MVTKKQKKASTRVQQSFTFTYCISLCPALLFYWSEDVTAELYRHLHAGDHSTVPAKVLWGPCYHSAYSGSGMQREGPTMGVFALQGSSKIIYNGPTFEDFCCVYLCVHIHMYVYVSICTETRKYLNTKAISAHKPTRACCSIPIATKQDPSLTALAGKF